MTLPHDPKPQSDPRGFSGLEPSELLHTYSHTHEMRSGSVAELGQEVMGSNVLRSRVLSTALQPGFK